MADTVDVDHSRPTVKEALMPLNRRYIGREFAARDRYEIGREKVREFADAVGDPHPAYRSSRLAQELGYPDTIAPPTFAGVIAASIADNPLFESEFGLQYDRALHGEQSFSLRRPLCVGDSILATSRIRNIRSAGTNEIVDIDTELHDAAGELVCTVTHTMVSRGTATAKE